MDDQEIRARALTLATAVLGSTSPKPPDLIAYARPLEAWIAGPSRMTLTVGGSTVPLTIDSANAKAILEFEDRDQDKVAPPAGAVATATSSDTAVLTVGPGTPGTDANGVATIEFALTEVSAGTSVLSVHATAGDGSPLTGPDGTTPIPDAAPVTVTVSPGAAAAEVFTVPGA